MIKMTIQDTEETAEFKVLEKPIIQKPLIAESDVVTIDNNLSTYVTGTQKRELTVGLGYLDSIGYETLRRIRDRQYAVLKYPTVTITADEPVDMGYGEDVPDYRQRLVQLRGKNLFDKNNTNQIIDDVYINTTANNLDASGGAGTGTIYISCSPKTTYTISKIVSSRFRVGTTSEKPVAGVSVSGIITNDSATKITITTGDNARYLCVYYRRSQSDSVTKQQLLDSIQIELGSMATTYEPYTNIELCKIGTYQDYIYKSGDKWYVHKVVDKIVLDGTESWIERSNTASDVYKIRNNVDVLSGNIAGVTTLVCSHFKTDGGANQANYNQQAICSSSTEGYRRLLWLSFPKTIATSVNTAKAWLATNQPSVYYALATPTETEITNATLKAQLNALQNSAFDRWTKVETNVQEPSLQPYLTVTQGDITDSGKEVMLEGTTEDLLGFVILGDTYQQTYSGKNLFNVAPATQRGVERTVNIDGSINLKGTNDGTGGSYFVSETKPISLMTNGGTYTCWHNLQSLPSGVEIRLGINNGGSWVRNLMQAISGTTKSRTFTANTSNGDAIRCEVYVSSGKTVDISNLKIQLEAGSTGTAFEPYVGGVPAPNPDYPQKVQTVNNSINFDFSGPSGVKKYTMVGKMTLADQRIIDNCGTNEQVQVSFRESKQL